MSSDHVSIATEGQKLCEASSGVQDESESVLADIAPKLGCESGKTQLLQTNVRVNVTKKPKHQHMRTNTEKTNFLTKYPILFPPKRHILYINNIFDKSIWKRSISPKLSSPAIRKKSSHQILCIIYFLMILFSTHTCHNLHLCNKT